MDPASSASDSGLASFNTLVGGTGAASLGDELILKCVIDFTTCSDSVRVDPPVYSRIHSQSPRRLLHF